MSVQGPLDLEHLGRRRTIGCYLVETGAGPALFDCGPTTCLPALRERLAERGLDLGDVDHLLLSHIHLDHAGAAGALVREHPGLQVHVSEVGAPHLADPARLERSARRLYGEGFDRLWGELAPVPEANLHVVGGRVLDLECFRAPGHASHHVCYLTPDGTLLAGDAAGVRIDPSRYVLPPTPPPDVDVDAWLATIGEIERRAPERLALIHFGLFADVAPHLEALRRRLGAWRQLAEAGLSEDEWVAAVRAELEAEAEDEADVYDAAMPLWQSYAGLRRFVEQRAA